MPVTPDVHKVGDTASSQAPIIIDMGRKRKKEIRQLREGHGELMNEVNALLQELQQAGSISASAQPVIIVVRQRQKAALLWPLG